MKNNNIRAFHYFLNKPVSGENFGWELGDIAPIIKLILPFKSVLFLDLFDSDFKGIREISNEFPEL